MRYVGADLSKAAAICGLRSLVLVSPFDAVDGGSADTECFGDGSPAFAFTAHFFNPLIGQIFELACFIRISPFLSNNIPRHDPQDVCDLNRLIFDD